MTNELEKITGILIQTHGVDVSKYDDIFLKKSIDRRISATECGSVSQYTDLLQSEIKEASLFLNSLHITFSEFFRNPVTFAYLEKVILPLLIEKKKINGEKEIRIWSAACAAGQEAYSIAILLDEIIKNTKTDIKCRIFATDNSREELEVARDGVYSATQLGRVTLRHVNSYFSQQNDFFTIVPRIQEYIDFSIFDLLADSGACPPSSIFGNFDIIFCSNLMFYYKQEYRKVIIEKICNCISEEGYLITGESERDIFAKQNFREIFTTSAIFQR